MGELADDGWCPTSELRFIERDRVVFGKWHKLRVLQQRWQRRWVDGSGNSEWRDVPLAKEGSA